MYDYLLQLPYENRDADGGQPTHQTRQNTSILAIRGSRSRSTALESTNMSYKCSSHAPQAARMYLKATTELQEVADLAEAYGCFDNLSSGLLNNLYALCWSSQYRAPGAAPRVLELALHLKDSIIFKEAYRHCVGQSYKDPCTVVALLKPDTKTRVEECVSKLKAEVTGVIQSLSTLSATSLHKELSADVADQIYQQNTKSKIPVAATPSQLRNSFRWFYGLRHASELVDGSNLKWALDAAAMINVGIDAGIDGVTCYPDVEDGYGGIEDAATLLGKAQSKCLSAPAISRHISSLIERSKFLVRELCESCHGRDYFVCIGFVGPLPWYM